MEMEMENIIKKTIQNENNQINCNIIAVLKCNLTLFSTIEL